MIKVEVTEDEYWDVIKPQLSGEDFRYLYVSKQTAKNFMVGRFDDDNYYDVPTVMFTFGGEDQAYADVGEFRPPKSEDNRGDQFMLLLDMESWHRVPPDNRSYCLHRQGIDDEQGESEKAAAKYWIEQNDESQNCSINFGHGSIQDKMLSIVKYDSPGSDFCPILTTRERRIVATFVQWLMTNCGRGFLVELFKKAGMNMTYENIRD